MSKTLKRIILVALVLAIGGGLWYYKLTKSARKVEQSILDRCPTDSSYTIAQIHIKEVVKLFAGSNPPLLSVNKDSTLWSLVKNPLATGINILVDPVYFSNEKDQFYLAFSISDTSSFKAYVQREFSKLYILKSLKTNELNGWRMERDSQSMSFYFDQSGLGLFTSKATLSDSVVTSFFKRNETIAFKSNFKANTNALVSILPGSNVLSSISRQFWPNCNQMLYLFATESTLELTSNAMAKSTLGYQQDSTIHALLHIKVDGNGKWKGSRLNEFNALFFRVPPVNMEAMYGVYTLVNQGVTKQSKVFISYDYNDDFEKVERRKTTYFFQPMLSLCFDPKKNTYSEMLDSCWKKNLFTKDDFYHFGDFFFPFFKADKKYFLGTLPANSVKFEKNQVLLFVRPRPCFRDLSLMNIDLPEARLVVFKKLNIMSLAKSSKGYNLMIEKADDEQAHVLGILASFLIA